MRGVRNAAIIDFAMSGEKTFDGGIVSKQIPVARLMHQARTMKQGLTARQAGRMAIDMLRPRVQTATYCRDSLIQFSTTSFASCLSKTVQKRKRDGEDNHRVKTRRLALEEYKESTKAPFPVARLENGSYIEYPLVKGNNKHLTSMVIENCEKLDNLLYKLRKIPVGQWTQQAIQQLDSIYPMTDAHQYSEFITKINVYCKK